MTYAPAFLTYALIPTRKSFLLSYTFLLFAKWNSRIITKRLSKTNVTSEIEK